MAAPSPHPPNRNPSHGAEPGATGRSQRCGLWVGSSPRNGTVSTAPTLRPTPARPTLIRPDGGARSPRAVPQVRGYRAVHGPRDRRAGRGGRGGVVGTGARLGPGAGDGGRAGRRSAAAIGARIEAAATSIGEAAVPIVADVSTPEGATAFVDEAIAALGRVDILVPNAGGPPAGTFASTPTRGVHPGPRAQPAVDGGHVPGRGAGHDRAGLGPGRRHHLGHRSASPSPTLILSNTARAGVTGVPQDARHSRSRRHGVTVNSVQPGIHATDRFRSAPRRRPDAVDAVAEHVPTRTVGRAEDFGAVVAFLCSDQARFVTGAAAPRRRRRQPRPPVGRRRPASGTVLPRADPRRADHRPADATEGEVDALVAGLRALPAQIPEIIAYPVGPDLGLAEGNASVAIVGHVRLARGPATYVDHPAHQAVVATASAPSGRRPSGPRSPRTRGLRRRAR